MKLFQLTDPPTVAVAKLKKKMVVLWPIKQIIVKELRLVFVREIFATLLLLEELILYCHFPVLSLPFLNMSFRILNMLKYKIKIDSKFFLFPNLYNLSEN